MTRRIAISILLTVWLVLILAGALAYFVTRSLLVADLDATLLARVASLPQIERPSSMPSVGADARDRVLIRNAEGQMERPAAERTGGRAAEVPTPEIVGRAFSTLPGGPRIRTITVKGYARRAAPGDPLVPVTVFYSGPTDRLDALLGRLLFSLGGFGLIAGLATAGVAVMVARTALLPLRTTADVIAAIGERNLDSRIAVDRLPPELQPVGLRLNDLLARLETAFGQRKQFLADASHELRTPVAALVTTLEVTLKKNRPAEEYARALNVCLADARLLHQLVAALLEQVRSEQFAPGSAVEMAPVRVSEVLQHCASMAGALAERRDVEVAAHIPENVAALTDELKLRSMVTNLLSNAVEYTPPGGRVTVTLDVLAGWKEPDLNGRSGTLPEGIDGTPMRLRVTVADSGPGISAEHLPHLFEPFYRADKARSEAGHHLGLGLFLVREHAVSLGGDCRAESVLGDGARFIIEWPVVMLGNEAPADAESPVMAGTALERTHG